MANLLVFEATEIELDDDLIWVDEFQFEQVGQIVTTSSRGVPIIDEAARIGGRTMTIEAGSNYGWMSRETVQALYDMAGAAGRVMTLTFRDIEHEVMFNRAAGSIDATPVVEYSDPADEDHYIVRLRFIKV